MRILHLIQTSGPGGSEKLLFTLSTRLKQPFESMVGLLQDRGWLYDELKNAKRPVCIVRSGGTSFDLKLLKNLIFLIKQSKADIVHSHLLDMNFYSSIAAALSSVPHVATEHGDIHHYSKKVDYRVRLKAKMVSKLTNKLVFVSGYTRRKFEFITGLKENKYRTIYNGVDLGLFSQPMDIESIRQELGIPRNAFIIGSVGSLYPVKGHSYLLKAFRDIAPRFPNSILIVLGQGGLLEELLRQVFDLGISGRVIFPGFKATIAPFVNAMNLFVLPSLSEGMPLSVLEAMACGLPIIASRVGGVPEIITHGKEGILVEPGDYLDLCEAMEHLMANRDLGMMLGYNAHKRVSESFSSDIMLSRYRDLFFDTVGEKRNK